MASISVSTNSIISGGMAVRIACAGPQMEDVEGQGKLTIRLPLVGARPKKHRGTADRERARSIDPPGKRIFDLGDETTSRSRAAWNAAAWEPISAEPLDWRGLARASAPAPTHEAIHAEQPTESCC